MFAATSSAVTTWSASSTNKISRTPHSVRRRAVSEPTKPAPTTITRAQRKVHMPSSPSACASAENLGSARVFDIVRAR